MKVKAHLNRLGIAPRKIRLVTGLVSKMNVDEARKQLGFLNKKSAEPILKLINSAVANAKNNFDLNEDNLYISEIFVNEGVTMKRWRPRAMGRAARINKRTSCVTVVLSELTKKISEMKKEKIEASENTSENTNEKIDDIKMVGNTGDNKVKKPLEKTVAKSEAKEDIKDVKTAEDKK